MGGDSKWWDNDPSDRTDEMLSEYSEKVKDLLLRDGKMGFLLGDPRICGYTIFQVCIFDPYVEIPENITLFANDINGINAGELPKETAREKFEYKFDKIKQLYDFSVEVESFEKDEHNTFVGTFDKMADINHLRTEI